MKKWILATAMALLGLTATEAQEKYEYNEFYYQRTTLFQQLPIHSTDIVFLGDSQTNGCEWRAAEIGRAHV